MNRFRNNFRFALQKESAAIRVDIPLNQVEKIGNVFSWFAYEFKSAVRDVICDPRFVTIVITSCFMILTALLFYPSITWSILGVIFKTMVHSIHWGYVRFSLWLLSELTVFGLGIRAFGRFSNQELMKHHGIA